MNISQLANKLSIFFSAGSLGGLLNSIEVWLVGLLGISTSLGVQIAPELSPEWLYPRVVWGGIWGVLFFIPFLNTRLFTKGILFSLPLSLVQLFIVFPLKLNKGIMGLELGTLTPVFVIVSNVVWGLGAACWVRLCGLPAFGTQDT